jgi:hypothetical protein
MDSSPKRNTAWPDEVLPAIGAEADVFNALSLIINKVKVKLRFFQYTGRQQHLLRYT